MNYFLCGLTLLFIGLKLTAHIAWSWWYILLPLYGGIVLVIGGGLALAGICWAILGLLSIFDSRKKLGK